MEKPHLNQLAEVEVYIDDASSVLDGQQQFTSMSQESDKGCQCDVLCWQMSA